ncbi:hypothetical protein Rsub_07648 [Raphidocelis subcapitata]|uniref:Uncharacterized protein n=1 Tax=Raphidocelis subcapitata TaxID=307507 RepID=A0A2V0PCD1_9CHLO|nr:hypothetical protein Rsub_07648 [Raphidocelis subcapitata]|eukprot:GBF94765.1 hypothetical protein Rsub_07648 [Raphidocelis subcapitata]
MQHAIAPAAPRGGAAAPAPGDGDGYAEHPPPRWINRVPTDQELLELSHRVYKHSRRLYSEADAQGLRVYHDERLDGSDVRVVMLVPSWFPRPHVSFDTVLQRLAGSTVSVVIVVRGTVRDLVGNTIANLQLLFNKLIDDQYLPEAATDTTKVVQGWLLELLARHPELRPPWAQHGAAAGYGGPEWPEGGVAGGGAGAERRLRLDVSITGHSLGGLIAEAATIESARFSDAHGMRWRCVSFESPGLPEAYHRSALRQRPAPGAWNGAIRGYLAAPNPINMLYPHCGEIIHVLAQWEQTWSHVARCVGADALRIAGWVAVASLTGSALQHVTGGGGRRRDDEERRSASPPAGGRAPQPVIASVLEGAAAAAGAAVTAGAGGGAARAPRGSFVLSSTAGAAGELLTRQHCLAGPASAAGGGGEAAAIASSAAAAAAAAIQSAVGAAANAGRATVSGTAIAAASGAAQHALRQVGVGLPLGTLAGWLLSGGGSLGLAKTLAVILGVEVEELVSQHGLGAMRPCFDSCTGELHPKGEVVLKAVQQVARWTLPSFMCHDNMGVWTMLSRTAMVEARCSRLQGYEPEASPSDVVFDRLYDIAPEDLRARAPEVEGSGSEAARAGPRRLQLQLEEDPVLMRDLLATAEAPELVPVLATAAAQPAAAPAAAQPQAGSVELPPAAAAAAAAAARAAAAAAAARHVGERAAAASALAEAEGAVRALEGGFVGEPGAPGVRSRASAFDELARRRAALAALEGALEGRRVAVVGEGGGDAADADALPPRGRESSDGSEEFEMAEAEPPAVAVVGAEAAAAAAISGYYSESEWDIVQAPPRRVRRRGSPDGGAEGPSAGEPMDCDGGAAAAAAPRGHGQQLWSVAAEAEGEEAQAGAPQLALA